MPASSQSRTDDHYWRWRLEESCNLHVSSRGKCRHRRNCSVRVNVVGEVHLSDQPQVATGRLPKDALLCAADMGVIARRTLPVESSDDMWHRMKMARVAIMLILLSQSFVDLWQFTTASGTFQKLLGFGISNDVNALLAAGIWAVTS